MSFIDNLLSSIRKSDSMEGSPCYTLYVHCDETEEIAEDDLAEPVAFQISMEMKWRDLQDLIRAEVGDAADSGFMYYDDENDEIRIDSQEEYETALHICRKDKRDVHIYSLRPPHRHKQRKKRRKASEKKRPDDEFTVLATEDKQPPQQQQEVTEPLHAPPAEEMRKKITDQTEPVEAEEMKLQPEGATAASSAPTDETFAASVEYQPEPEQETTPMPVENSLIGIIKKEVREVLADELDDVWRFVNALKRDINRELDVIGDQLTAHSAQLPGAQKQITDQVNKAEISSRQSESSESETSLEPEVEEDEEANFAATFICESLLDGSTVQAGENFEKHWVFRNDGNRKWDESTELHLLYQTCNPPAASGTSLSEWGAKHKSVIVPLLKQGESGVVCAEHTAPAHGCNYISSWRLNHKDSPFGPRVWCNVRIENKAGTSVDDERNLDSFEDLHAEGTSLRKSLERTEEGLHGSLVPANKLQVEVKSPKPDEALHNDTSIMSFNMADISDGAKYIESHPHESEPYNPAVTSVEQQHGEDEPLHVSLTKKENIGASVDAKDHSSSSESPVMVTPPESEEILHEPELDDLEEPRTLENEGEEEDLYSSKYEKRDVPPYEEQDENFTEPVVRTPDRDYSSEEEVEEREEEEPEPQEVRGRERQISEDLQSVDYNLDDDMASMMSYASDFVVVPLPECFDVNKPLTESQYEEKKETESMVSAEPQAATGEQSVQTEEEEEDVPPRYPPDESSDSEVESQPPSVNRANEYHSEDSLVPTATPKSPPKASFQPKSVTPKVSLAPIFVTPQNETPVCNKEPQAPKTPDSMDDSLTEKITKEFDAFLSNPQHPINPPPKPKITLNQIPTSGRQVPIFNPEPIPVPQSVLEMDDPYPFDPAETNPHFIPFEQGWRRNPIPVPSSVTNYDPWPLTHDKPTPAPRLPSQLPRSQFTLEQDNRPTESALPSHPFAVASPSTSILSPDSIPATRRPASPEIPIVDDFYPADLQVAGLNLYPHDYDEPNESEIFRTPPPSPPPRDEVELSPLDQLYEMGFHDLDLNRKTFEQCEQDLNRTVQALILRAEADEEMMA